jgi:hypothetical protein
MKFNEEVNRNRAVYLTFYWVFRVSGWICGGSTDGILVPFFGPVFWVDFSPFFGLRGSRERRVSRGLVKLDGDFGPFLSPILDGLFTVHFIMIRGLLSWAVVGVLEVVHALGGVQVSRRLGARCVSRGKC